jgi:MFS family permease
VLSVEGVMHGLYLLWWVQEKHVSAALVAAVLAAGDAAVALLEIPAGWLADRYGHRASLIAGSAIQAIAMFACWQGHGVAGLLAASVLVALGDVFRSGADQALLYRSCTSLGQDDGFQRIEARARSLQRVALAGLAILGGIIVTHAGFAAGWLAEIGCSVAGFVVACAMREPPAAIVYGEELAEESPPLRTRIPFRAALLAIIVPVAVLGTLAGTTAFVLQIADAAVPAATTQLVAGITLAEAAGSLAASRMRSSVWVLIALSAAGGALSVVALALPASLPLVAVALALLLGAAEPLRSTVIQRTAADDERAQAASLASAVDKTLSTIGLMGVGWWR